MNPTTILGAPVRPAWVNTASRLLVHVATWWRRRLGVPGGDRHRRAGAAVGSASDAWAQLDAHLLRDIGAPPSWCDHAQRRHAERQLRIEQMRRDAGWRGL